MNIDTMQELSIQDRQALIRANGLVWKKTFKGLSIYDVTIRLLGYKSFGYV